MATKLENFNKIQLKKNIPDIRPGDTVKVYQKVPSSAKAKESEKEKNRGRAQTFEGIVIAIKHGKGISGTITVRRLIQGIGVEKIYPLHSPNIEKVEILKRGKVRRAKLYWLRDARGKRARLKQKEFAEVIPEEEKETPAAEEIPAEEKE